MNLHTLPCNLAEKIADRWRRFVLRARSMVLYRDWNFPLQVTVEVQSRCNRRCHYCANSVAPQQRRIMSVEMFGIVTQRLQEIGWRGLVTLHHLSEPLLDPRLPELVKTLHERVPDCYPMIYTNGDLLTPEKLRELISAGLRLASITRHPPFSVAWDERMAGLKRDFPRHIELRGVLADKSWLTTWGGVVKLTGLRPAKTCFAVREALVVLAGGEVLLCCCCANTDASNTFGNLRHNSILEIWRGGRFKAMRRQAASGKPTHPLCIDCYESRKG